MEFAWWMKKQGYADETIRCNVSALRVLANKLQNPRLKKITFHTFRHWKATMLYHQTKDPYYVKQFLGHKTLKNTEIYITIEKTIFGEYSDEFTVKVASKPEEIKGSAGGRLRVRLRERRVDVLQEAQVKSKYGCTGVIQFGAGVA